MKDLFAEGLFLFSAFTAIVIMLIIIAKERRKKKTEDLKSGRKHVKKSIHSASEGLYLD